MITEQIGTAKLWRKNEAEAFAFHPSHYPALKAAWMAGQAFFEGVDPYGDEICVRLGDVSAICLNTPEGIARWQADRDDDERREALGIG